MSKHDLEILPVLKDPSKPVYRQTHENILSPPFRLAVIGSSKSGKCLDGNGYVQTRMGYKRLIDMDIGEFINTREGFCKITDIIENGKKSVVDVYFSNRRMITATIDHKVDTQTGLVRVGDLTKEHIIWASAGTTTIVSVKNLRKIDTYDLTIENKSHTFYYQDISVSNSSYVVNLLRPCYYGGGKGVKPCFDKIIVFSPNIGMDETTRCFKKLCKPEDIKQDYKDHYIDNIIASQKSKEGHEEKILIIADDLPALGAINDARIFTSASYLRHLNVSIIYISQVYKGRIGGLSPLVRNNLDGMIMFRSPSQQQINAFCEDMAGTFGSKENVKNLLSYATREPYNFAFFDYRNLSVWKNHTEFLWEKYTADGKYSPDFKLPPGFNKDDNEED